MRRKIKKGPGKARQMPVKDLRHVVATYRGCSYVTAGKMYRVKPFFGSAMLCDLQIPGSHFIAMGQSCPHLDEIGSWYHPFK